MKYISFVLCLILLILDILISMFLILHPRYWWQFLIAHAVITVLISFLMKKIQEVQKGIPVYLIFFLPGLGGVIVFILYFSLSYFIRDSIVLSDYELLIEFENNNSFKEKINYNKEIRTMSFLDVIEVLDSEEKKQFIIESEIFEDKGKIKLFQKGLSDSDIEIQHYSATLLNDKENDYTNLIDYLKEEYNILKDYVSLENLSKAYKNYIDSGLISGELLYIINNDYIETLNKMIKIKQKDLMILDELVKAYIKNDDFLNAEKTNKILLKEYPNNCEGVLNKLNISFEKDLIFEFNKVINGLTEMEIKSCKRVEELVSFWIRKKESI
ncbi:tetratricopeptide repeat protein [Clostridium grantii]|uniref:Uncharacterized protein n=1 Tax=Clostridium grantii DSM 8605 TaxID=1121316 RepID=A0A1M5W0G8_9CLOT|nr:hypothetical protein [Clostridium grantii]SHH80961.1 hypothetical protein SAMN02745207_02597 [Clostridium grantii DSM 8605]